MAKKTAAVNDKILSWYDPEIDQRVTVCDIVSDWDTWQKWLDDEKLIGKSFRFITADKFAISVVRELRPHFKNDDDMRPHWYAHKRKKGKLYRRYVGTSNDCTYKKLAAISAELARL